MKYCCAGSSSDGTHVLLLLLCGKFIGDGKGVWDQKKQVD